jgi:membrane-associated phospholipid phosphatase
LSSFVTASPRAEFLTGINFARLRASEKILFVYFTYTSAAAWLFPVAGRQRLLLLALNAMVCATVVALGNSPAGSFPRFLTGLRNGLPAALIILAYRESGLLLLPDSTYHLDRIFLRLDLYILQSHVSQALLRAGAPWLQRSLELSYLFCYPLVPLGAVAVYAVSKRQENRLPPPARAAEMSARFDAFWTAVLLATLACYTLSPFFPLTPPRVLFPGVPGSQAAPWLRQVNFWLLDRYSVQACIFPSGHVAAATAVALALRRHASWARYVFTLAAVSIAAATVVGRYHYIADALAGALVGIGACVISHKLPGR